MIPDHKTALAAEPFPAAEGGEIVTIDTRFGTFEFTPEHRVYMPRGLHGFPDYREFALANLPPPAPEHFKLLQSLDDSQLAFIVTPLDPESGGISGEDLLDGALSVGISMEQAMFLLVVTLRPRPGGTGATVNLRAPIVLDMSRRLARQVVLADNRYPIQHALDRSVNDT